MRTVIEGYVRIGDCDIDKLDVPFMLSREDFKKLNLLNKNSLWDKVKITIEVNEDFMAVSH